MRPRAVTFVGRFLTIMGAAALFMYAFVHVGRMVWAGFAEALQVYGPNPFALAMMLPHGIAYTVLGVAILHGKSWGFWGYVIYVPLVDALMMGSKFGYLMPVNWIGVGVYLLFVVLLSRPRSRLYLHLEREGPAT